MSWIPIQGELERLAEDIADAAYAANGPGELVDVPSIKDAICEKVDEFSGRHNLRCADTLEQMGVIVRGLEGKRLMYHKLIEDNGLSTRARA